MVLLYVRLQSLQYGCFQLHLLYHLPATAVQQLFSPSPLLRTSLKSMSCLEILQALDSSLALECNSSSSSRAPKISATRRLQSRKGVPGPVPEQLSNSAPFWQCRNSGMRMRRVLWSSDGKIFRYPSCTPLNDILIGYLALLASPISSTKGCESYEKVGKEIITLLLCK